MIRAKKRHQLKPVFLRNPMNGVLFDSPANSSPGGLVGTTTLSRAGWGGDGPPQPAINWA
jgi:hypothetical protein